MYIEGIKRFVIKAAEDSWRGDVGCGVWGGGC